jgi:hypothetical protein
MRWKETWIFGFAAFHVATTCSSFGTQPQNERLTGALVAVGAADVAAAVGVATAAVGGTVVGVGATVAAEDEQAATTIATAAKRPPVHLLRERLTRPGRLVIPALCAMFLSP